MYLQIKLVYTISVIIHMTVSRKTCKLRKLVVELILLTIAIVSHISLLG